MVIAPEAIEDFLHRDVEPLPPFKGADAVWLEESIRKSTGVTFVPRTPHRPHQHEGLAAMLWLRRGLLFFDTRIGKTKVALDWASALKQAGLWRGQGLVITHAPIGTVSWDEQIPEHSNLTYACIEAGAEERLFKAVEDEVDLIVMSWSTIQSLLTVKKPSRAGPMKLYPNYELIRLLAPAFKLVVIDEIHRVQDWTGLWTLLGSELVKSADYRLGLSATPTGRNPLVVWPQFFLIDEGETLGRHYKFFEAAFCKKSVVTMRGRRVELMTFDKSKWPLLQKKIASISLSYKRSEIHEINVENNPIKLPLHPRQELEYEKQLELARDIREDDTKAYENVFVRLRQISSGFLPFKDEEGERRVVRLPCSKLDWLDEFLTSVPQDLQFIIYHEFIPTGTRLAELLEKRKVSHVRLYSGTKSRAETLRKFQSGEARCFLANAVAASMSIDLPMADYILYYESPMSSTTRKQSEDRPMSRGAKLLIVDDLVCSPVERKILGFVKEGKDVLGELMRGPGGFYNSLKLRR